MRDTNLAAWSGESNILSAYIGYNKEQDGLYTLASLSSVSANIFTNLYLWEGLICLYSAHQLFEYSKNFDKLS